MNQSQIHLALTHLPVVLTLTGMILLFISLVKKNQSATRISFYLLIAAALFVLPVFFTGEGAEEVVEHLPGVSEQIIERHEGIARVSLFFILATGLLAIAGLFNISGRSLVRALKFPVLAVALISSGLLAYTAHLGGQIRHSEIRKAFVQNAGDNETSNEKNPGPENGQGNKNSEDDD